MILVTITMFLDEQEMSSLVGYEEQTKPAKEIIQQKVFDALNIYDFSKENIKVRIEE